MQRSYELWRDETAHTNAWHINNNQYYVHFHSTIELIYVESGVLCAVQNGESQMVPADRLIVNSSYIVHGYSTPQSSRIIVATIPLSTVPALRVRLEQNRFARGVVDASEVSECRAILNLMADPAHRDNRLFVDSLGEALLALLIERVGLTPNAADAESDLMKRVLSYLRERAARPATVAEVAARFGYSAGRFSHIFNANVGCSLPRYMNSLRCQMAERMLLESDAPITEIAAKCGFSSVRTFHRVYREYAGRTPRG